MQTEIYFIDYNGIFFRHCSSKIFADDLVKWQIRTPDIQIDQEELKQSIKYAE